MLLINGFIPIQNNCNDQMVSKNFFRQSQFQLKNDIVSFKSNVLSAQAADFTRQIGERYSDVFRENFAKVISEPFLGLLKRCNVAVGYEEFTKGKTNSVFRILLTDKDGKPIDIAEDFRWGYTKNDATVTLIDNLIKLKDDQDLPDSLRELEFSEELMGHMDKIREALMEVIGSYRLENNTEMQKALKILMPE